MMWLVPAFSSTKGNNAMDIQAEKIEKLRKALDNFERAHARGESDFFDHEKEEKKANVRRRALLLLNQRARSVNELSTRLKAL